MARKDRYTAEQVIAALKGTGGVVSMVADRLGCTWKTAKKYITEYATVQQAYQDEKHRVDDAALYNLVDSIVNKKNVKDSKWWLAARHPDFMPKQRTEITGKDGGSIEASIDLELTAQERVERIESILDRARDRRDQ